MVRDEELQAAPGMPSEPLLPVGEPDGLSMVEQCQPRHAQPIGRSVYGVGHSDREEDQESHRTVAAMADVLPPSTSAERPSPLFRSSFFIIAVAYFAVPLDPPYHLSTQVSISSLRSP